MGLSSNEIIFYIFLLIIFFYFFDRNSDLAVALINVIFVVFSIWLVADSHIKENCGERYTITDYFFADDDKKGE